MNKGLRAEIRGREGSVDTAHYPSAFDGVNTAKNAVGIKAKISCEPAIDSTTPENVSQAR